MPSGLAPASSRLILPFSAMPSWWSMLPAFSMSLPTVESPLPSLWVSWVAEVPWVLWLEVPPMPEPVAPPMPVPVVVVLWPEDWFVC